MKDKKNAIVLKCNRIVKQDNNKVCNYEWSYRGESLYALCPRCKQMTIVKDIVKRG